MNTENPVVELKLVPQTLKLKTKDGRIYTVSVLGMPTACPLLVITPSMTVNVGDTTPRFSGDLILTHVNTGLSVSRGDSAARLEELAAKLTGFDWQFTDPDYFTRSENEGTKTEISKILRQWIIDGGYDGPVSLYGDDEDQRAARNAAPAATLLREQLDWWPKHHKSIYDRKLLTNNQDAWGEAVSASAQGWGIIYLLAVLLRIDPQIADVAGRFLTAEFDSGDSMGEWVAQWQDELASGKQPTLPGIPPADPWDQR